MKIIFSLLITVSAFFASFAQSGNNLAVASQRAEKATTILKQFSSFDSDSVPFEVLRKAKAVGVFNDVTRFSLFLSEGIKAKGVLSARNQNGWSVPVFISLAGSGFQFKIAAKKNFDIVFFVMNDEYIKALEKRGLAPKMTLGPIVGGKGAELALQKASILYYTFEDGKLSGEEVEGNSFINNVIIGLDNNLNKSLYNKTAQIILKENLNDLKTPATVENFRQTISDMLSHK